MPVMGGFEATRRIRKDGRFKDLPIIAMTAHAMAGDREETLEAGMNDHVTKPINPDDLFSTLVRWHSCPKTVFRENLKMSSFWEIVVLPQATKSQGNKEDGNNDTLCKPFQSTGCAI